MFTGNIQSIRKTCCAVIIDGDCAIVVDYTGTKVHWTRDHWDAVQMAIELVARNGGGKVELGPGTYKLKKTLTVPSNVALVGAGPATRLVPEFGGPVIEVTDASNIKVGDFAIVDEGAITNTFAIVLDCVSKSSIFGIYLRNVFGVLQLRSTVTNTNPTRMNIVSGIVAEDVRHRAVEVQEDVSYCKLSDIYIRNAEGSENGIVLDSTLGGVGLGQREGNKLSNITVLSAGGLGIYIKEWTDLQLTNITVEESKLDGIVIEADTKTATRIYIINAKSRNNGGNGLKITGTATAKATNIIYIGDLSKNGNYGAFLQYCEKVRIYATADENTAGKISIGTEVTNLHYVLSDEAYADQALPTYIHTLTVQA